MSILSSDFLENLGKINSVHRHRPLLNNGIALHQIGNDPSTYPLSSEIIRIHDLLMFFVTMQNSRIVYVIEENSCKTLSCSRFVMLILLLTCSVIDLIWNHKMKVCRTEISRKHKNLVMKLDNTWFSFVYKPKELFNVAVINPLVPGVH